MTSSSSPTSASVRARDWGWRHAGRREFATRGVDFRIEAGERVLILGASGSGKSTLLHGLAGVLGSTDEGDEEGQLLIDGVAAADARGRVGLVVQDPDAGVVLAKVGDDVAFGPENLGVPRDEIWRRVHNSLALVGLDVSLDRSTNALSGGQKQRLALAGVLAMHPGLLVLDEPTANLDPEGVLEVRDAVAQVLDQTGATLVVVEHRVAVWQHLVERVIVLGESGGVIADGPLHEVLAHQGEYLAAQGVWVPGHEHPIISRARVPESCSDTLLLSTSELSVARVRGTAVARDISTAVHAGRMLAVTGPNGAGKSTMALTLAGLIPAESGEVRASDRLRGRLGTHPFAWKSKELLGRIGTVFQSPEHQFLRSTLREELLVGPRALGISEQATTERVDELLVRLRLEKLSEANPFTLSGGQKRRLSVATVLASAPSIVVLDEPTFGQDARTWFELVNLLGELLDEGTGIVAVSHDAEFVRALANDRYALWPTGHEAQR